LIALFFVFGLFWGLQFDIAAIPPSFGPAHQQAYNELYAQALPSGDYPPPSKALYAGGEILEQELLPLSLLSPRAGFNAPTSKLLELWSRRLGAGWYIDWTVQPRYPFQRPVHWQMVRLSQDSYYPTAKMIVWLASRFPGNVWIIGNEPDNIWQDNISPETYAQLYHDLYALIKDADPSARVAVGGVTQATPLRLAYLDRVLITYEKLYNAPLPTDWWTVHGFVLREERGSWGAEIPVGFPEVDRGELYEIWDVGSVDLFKGHLIAFRSWMAERGYQNTPLAITEFGILLSAAHGYPPSYVADYLAATFEWLDQTNDLKIGYSEDDYRLVQRWAWFSLFDKLFYSSNLANIKEDAITDIGWEFRSFVEEWRP
jgi:hypothetical protein